MMLDLREPLDLKADENGLGEDYLSRVEKRSKSGSTLWNGPVSFHGSILIQRYTGLPHRFHHLFHHSSLSS